VDKTNSLSEINWKKTSLLSLSISLLSILTTYSQRRFTLFDTYFFNRDDGWCDKFAEGIYLHCFGDFNQGVSPDLKYDFAKLPNDASILLSPMDGIIWKIGSFSHNLLGGRTTLILFFLLYSLLVLYGWSRLSSSLNLSRWFVFFGFTSYPSIYALMRMNNICILFPIFVLYLNSVSKDEKRRQVLLIALISIFKPQLAVLAGVDFSCRNFKIFFQKLALIIFSIFCVIGFQFGFSTSQLIKYLETIRGYGTSSFKVLDFYPQNASVSHAIGVFYQGIGFEITQNIIYERLTLLTFVMIILIGIFAITKNKIKLVFYFGFLTLFSLTIFTGMYYLLILNAITCFLLSKEDALKARKLLKASLLVSSSYLLIPYVNQGKIVAKVQQLPEYVQIISGNLTFPLAILFFILFILRNIIFDISLAIDSRSQAKRL